jgi:gliding motility-associated-like protein
MIKFIHRYFFVLLCFSVKFSTAQFITTNVNPVITGKLGNCIAVNGLPTVTVKFLSGTGSNLNASGSLVILNPCDTSQVEISINNVRWDNGAPDVNWLHSVYFPSSTGFLFQNAILPVPPTSPTASGWVFMPNGCTGVGGGCINNPSGNCQPGPGNAGTTGGPGWYYRNMTGTSGNGGCCPGGQSTPSPCDNWGDGSLSCNNQFPIKFTARICNNALTNSQYFLKLRFDMDGNTGCWGCQNINARSEIVFSINIVPFTATLYSPPPTATPPVKTCTPSLMFTDTLKGGCGNGNTIEWWTLPTGGILVGTGSPFIYTGLVCAGGTTLYAACCPVGNTCNNRKPFLIPNSCPPPFTLDNISSSQPSCASNCGTISATTVSGAIGPVTYTLMPGNITNTTGAFGCLTGTSYTVTARDSVGCEASGGVSFIPAICGAPIPHDTTYCLNQPAVPIRATLTPGGSNLQWYTTLTGGVGSTTAPTPSTAIAGPTTYYVTQTVGGVESTPRTPLVVTVLALPAAPLITNVAATCTLAGMSTISNYVATNTYTFTPAGPTVGGTGLVSGMTVGTSYTVTTNNGTCTSLASASFSNAAMLVTPAVPTITSVAPTCLSAGTSTISNYIATNIYTFTPTGPTVGATGLINGMTVGTSYTVTSGNATCTSLSSSSFSNAAMLVTPAVPTITAVAATCTVAGTSTISNYNAANTYTFSPLGPLTGAGGIITGMVIGTNYTVTATLGTCISAASATFSNAVILVTPAVPTITSVAATCTTDGTSTISNYNIANTYTFSPAGPTVGGTGLIAGMILGTSYTVTSGNVTCTSLASTSFSNAAMFTNPVVPTITVTVANCTTAGTSTISNYVLGNVYTFTPAGPTVGATGLISGMTIGTSYTVTSGVGTCTSAASVSFSNAAIFVTPAVPTITSVAPTCVVAGTSTISNYSAANTYTFSPTGPAINAVGLVTGMVIGTSYTVTSGNATCTSLASSSFSNAAILVTPVVPTITSVAPTCAADGTSTISNYLATNIYTFTPVGPIVGAGGLVTGMIVGTSYTVTSGNGSCTSTVSLAFSNAIMLTTPAVPTITSEAPTCVVAGTSTISNYSAANTYTFSPTGPAINAVGLVTGMVIGTSYTVTSGNATCTSLASSSFSNAAILVTPVVPTITSVAPTCAANGTSTINNYNATYTYTFTPVGPTVNATGLVSGMTIGTSYTVTAGLGICASTASLTFSNAVMLTTPPVPTITSVAPTCVVAGTSTISNYNAANTYTFSPTGPVINATGLVTGMVIGTSYTVTSGNATCTSLASNSFSNAAILVTPVVPTITSVAPTCAANGTSTINNYNAAYTYTFAPSGPTVNAAGLVSGMTIGTSYTVISGLGICTSVTSAAFSNAIMLTTPPLPTITSVPPTCVVAGTSTISNYNAANTYTFSPTGPAINAVGLVTGMVIGTSYAVTSGNATCTSLASSSFSNAAILVTPPVPTITAVAPTCAANGTSTINNYNAAYTYAFAPVGPTVNATGLVTGMAIGTSYTVTAGLGICTSTVSLAFSNAIMLTTPPVPTITSVAPTCVVAGTSAISNYNAANTYIFSPTGPAINAVGLVTGMIIGTSYTVTSGNTTCTSLASNSFSNAAILVTPTVPTITGVAPTCAANGTSRISNYIAAYTYKFTPIGPMVNATGLVTGMTIGTSYTVTAGLGICTSTASLTFSNAVILTTPPVPTITSVAPTCVVAGTSTISNYNAANTYTFSPTGPAINATGLVTGMVIGTSYTVTSGNATCTSLASTSFSNAAILVTPTAPLITTTLPTCTSNGISTVSNYAPTNTYIFVPVGPSTGVGGVITGMTVGTLYTVTSSNTTCTSLASSIFNITAMLPTPVAPTTTARLHCQNTTVTVLTAVGANIKWYTSATGGTAIPAPTPATATAGIITYYASQTVNGCESPRAALAVTIIATPAKPEVISPVNYCPGDPSMPLIATTGINLKWYTTATGGVGSTTAITPSTATPGTFTYYVTQSTTIGSCESARTPIIVNINNNSLSVIVLPLNDTICEGEKITYNPIVTPEAISYEWTAIGVPSSTISDARSKVTTVSPKDDATYTLKSTLGGCATITTVKVKVIWKPIINAGNNIAICANESVFLKPSVTHKSGDSINYYWTPIDSLKTPTELNTLANPIASTWYTVKYVTKPAYGCDFTDSSKVKVIIQPKVKAFAGNDTIAVKGSPHKLRGTGGINYSWISPNGITITNPFSQNALITLNNDANVYLTVKDGVGCEAKDSIFIKVYEGPTYYIPNSFTPNGDGLNDVFRALPVGIANTTYFRVFNRLGQVMFETNQWLKGWDGTFKGIPQPSGTYVWIVSGVDKDNKKVEMNGTVNIVR